MQTATSKLTKKYQATIPKPVRSPLHLEAGDSIAFAMEGDIVYLHKAHHIDLVFIQSLARTLSDWASEADEEAYHNLE